MRKVEEQSANSKVVWRIMCTSKSFMNFNSIYLPFLKKRKNNDLHKLTRPIIKVYVIKKGYFGWK